VTLIEALQLSDGEVVALVGAGGKTTTMFALARELCSRGKGVVATTTTRILRPTPDQSPCLLVESSLKGLLARLPQSLAQHRLVAVGSALESDGKLVGIDPGWVESLQRLPGIDNILIEADGAAGKPFKAPAPHEPVIPQQCNLVVPMVGIEVIGQVLEDEKVHRAERVAALASITLGQAITSEVVAKVLLHPEGNIKGSPPKARIIPLINKVDDDSRLAEARELAQLLIERGAGRVVLAHAAFEPPVVEVLTNSF